MPQNGNSNFPIDPYLAQLLARFNSQGAPQQQPTTPAQQPAQSPMYASVGGVMMPLDPSQFGHVDPAADLKTVMGYMPKPDAGPYTPTSQGETETSHEYQNRLNSPYMMFGADNRFAQGHPRMAGMLDNAFLGGSLVGQAHARSLAEGGGVEGAGGAIGDVMQGIMGMPQARLQYRQNLEQMPLEYQSAESKLQESQAGTLQHLMGALSSYESNPAKILSMANRDTMAAAIGGQSRENVASQNNATKLFTAVNSDETKKAIAHIRAASSASSAARSHYQTQILNGLNTQIGQINSRYDKLENSPVVENGLARQRNSQEIAALEQERQAEITNEIGYGESVTQGVFKQGLLDVAKSVYGIQPQPRTPNRPPARGTIFARDPQGTLHSAPAGSKLPKGWTPTKGPKANR